LAEAAPALRLKAGREKSLRQRHPWIFSGAVAAVDGTPDTGDTVTVISSEGAFLARAAYSPASQIRARVWTFDPDTAIDPVFFERKVLSAVEARAPMQDPRHTACRLIHGESDGLPGVVADRYAETVVVQLSSAGAERWRDAPSQHSVRRQASRLRALGCGRAGAKARAESRHRERHAARRGDLVEDGPVYRRRAAGQDGVLSRPARNRAAVRGLAAGRR
jgi:23S rRNA (cytosine1962-C5)-methyltransferase